MNKLTGIRLLVFMNANREAFLYVKNHWKTTGSVSQCKLTELGINPVPPNGGNQYLFSWEEVELVFISDWGKEE